MRRALLFLFIILILNGLSSIMAVCDNGDIDINSASAEDLDKLSGIGPAYAKAIIDTRPFGSVEDLIDVKGIGPVTLDKIKTQGLACVSGEEESAPVEEEVAQEDENTQDTENIPQEETQNAEEQPAKEKATIKKDVSVNKEEIKEIETAINTNMSITGEAIKTIVLSPSNPKDIKSETDKEQLSKNKFAIYGLIVFCILLVILFGFKKTKDEKNEFR
jgi:competence ComEA-like helix-hairpin-helix protein